MFAMLGGYGFSSGELPKTIPYGRYGGPTRVTQSVPAIRRLCGIRSSATGTPGELKSRISAQKFSG